MQPEKALGWTEHSEGPPGFPTPFWSITHEAYYCGVVRDDIDENRYYWFVSQGKNGDPDDEPTKLAHGYEPSPLMARNEAAAWWNANRFAHLPEIN